MDIALETDKMLAEKDGQIGYMIFNNPDRLNAVGYEMWQGMATILDAFAADPDVRVVVLKGAGDRAFVSGADISQFDKVRADSSSSGDYDNVSGIAQGRLQNFPKPTIAMIRGYCIGGGMAIALGCDLRIATEESTFAVPAAKLGLGYGASGIRKLMELTNSSFAKEIFFTARQFSAEEAAVMGVINRIVPDGELESYVKDYCTTIAGNAPMTVASVKTIVNEYLAHGDHADKEMMAKIVAACFDSDDYKEGRKAFMEKRKPAFKGN